MVNQPKRIDLNSTSAGIGLISARFGPGTGTILRRLTNYHNIWGSISIEPQTAGANSNGWWVLWLKPDVTNADPSFNSTAMNDGTINQKIIACGTWACSNESVFNKEIHLQSSRNLVANMEMVLSVRIDGITAGVNQINILLCASLSVK